MNRIIDFLDRHLPTLMVGVFLGTRSGKAKALKLKAELHHLKIRVRRYEIRETLKKQYNNMPDWELYERYDELFGDSDPTDVRDEVPYKDPNSEGS